MEQLLNNKEQKVFKKKNSIFVKQILRIFICVITYSLIVFTSREELVAQGGSNYSLFGIGDLSNVGGAFYEGLSGTAISVASPYAINLKNPAMWSNVQSTRLQIGYKFNQHLSSSSGQTLFQNNGKINDVLAVLSIDTSLGLNLSFGLYTYSSVNYYVSSRSETTYKDLSVSGTTVYQGGGGISNAYFGAAIRPTNFLSLGASVIGHLGTLSTSSQTRYDQEYAFQSNTLKSISYGGISTKFGVNILPIDDFSLGAFVNLNNSFGTTTSLYYQSQFQKDSSVIGSVDFALPTELGVGVSYKTGKFLIAGDLISQDFTNFNYNQRPSVDYKNNLSASLGVRREGNPNRTADFADRISYTFGINYTSLYYRANGENLSQVSASIGGSTAVPGTGMVDVALTFGHRGTQSSGLISEFFGRLVVNLSIGDTWFKPIRRLYD